MAPIFSTHNLQTFLRRKYLRPPSRPPGPPGRGGRPSRSPNEGRCPDGRSPEGRSPPAGRSPPELAARALISAAMMLLKNRRWFLVGGLWPLDLGPRSWRQFVL